MTGGPAWLSIQPLVGLWGPEDGKNIKQVVVVFFIVFVIVCLGFLFFYYSKIVNLGSRMDCNTVFPFGTFKTLTKHGPSDPLFITEILLTI